MFKNGTFDSKSNPQKKPSSSNSIGLFFWPRPIYSNILYYNITNTTYILNYNGKQGSRPNQNDNHSQL